MFSEQTFISDFIDANFARNQEHDIDYEEVRRQICEYGDETFSLYSDEELKEIADLYNTQSVEFDRYVIFYNRVLCDSNDYKSRAKVALRMLYSKIFEEYIIHDCSDAGTEYGDDEDYEF